MLAKMREFSLQPLFAIRQACEADADAIAEAHIDSIHSLGALNYDAEIVAEWGEPRDGSRYIKAMHENDGIMFIAEPTGSDLPHHLLGFSGYSLEDGKHQVGVYVRGSAARMGVGSALLAAAEAVAKNRGAAEIHLDSALGALAFYCANGYAEIGDGEHKMRSGRIMPCVFMKKILAL